MTFVPNYPFELPARQPVSRLCPCIIIGTFAICANQNGYKPAFSPQFVHPRDANRRQPLPHHFASETFEGQRTLSECKLAGTKIHKPEKDETPSLSDPGPLNVRCPHPHRVQPTEAGCCIVKPNRKKEDHGKDRMYRGAELATAPRTGGTPLRPCPTSGTSFDATAGRRVIGQRGGMPGAEYHQTHAAKLPGPRCDSLLAIGR